jgi:RNA polymerase sigma-70 factor (ECF subfamily)
VPQRYSITARLDSGERLLDPELLAGHRDALTRAALELCRSHEDAEDLVQDTLTQVLARPRLIHTDERNYLLRAMRNTFYRHLRDRSRRPKLVNGGEQLIALAPVAANQQSAAECGELLRAIAQLPEDLRAVVVQIDLLGSSYKEIAERLQLRDGTVASRLHRGRRRLAQGLSA